MDTRRGPASGLVLVVVAGLLWLLAAPAHLGGTLTVVSIQGTSMEPTLVSGDLVVLRRAPTYEIGEAVAFRSDMAGTTVLHRIVAVEPGTGRYILIGDNNAFLDRYRPLPEEVVGRMVLRLPGDVGALARLATPWLLAAAGTLLLLLGFQIAGFGPSRRRRPLSSSRRR